MAKTVKTTWDKIMYDVWGNAEDGYIVNDSFNWGEVDINCPIEFNNSGTSQFFTSAFPTEKQLAKIFDYDGEISADGDDSHIYVNADDGYPLGELILTSHASLSPIRVN